MTGNSRRFFGALLLLTLAGCGDTPESLMRTGSNIKSELIDHLMKVKDQESARKFTDFLTTYRERRLKDLNDKWQKKIKDDMDDLRPEVKKVRAVLEKTYATDAEFQAARNTALAAFEKVEATCGPIKEQYQTVSQVNDKLLARETARIKTLVNSTLNPSEQSPDLVKLTEPDAFKDTFLSPPVLPDTKPK